MLGFDHAVIYVQELDQAVTDFSALGFQVIPGGEHPDWGTHNALIVFQDHTYLELLAEMPGASPTRPSFLYEPGQPFGLSTFALRSDEIEKERAALQDRGLRVSEIMPGSRNRPDGVRVEWLLARLEDGRTPFFIEDVTPRTLRISDRPDETHHKNEVIGVEELVLLVADMGRSLQKYQAIFSILPRLDDVGNAFFALGKMYLVLRMPVDAEERRRLGRSEDLPYEVNLKTGNARKAGSLEIDRTHGAHIRLSGVGTAALT